jgi:hypothetical protein
MMGTTENKMIENIWDARAEHAQAEIRKAQARHAVTANPFYMEEIKYWSALLILAKSRNKSKSLKAA